MEWSDTGIVLSTRSHGETDAIVEVLTGVHGRHLGLVHGGASRKIRPLLQPGNTLTLQWRARLAEHLGTFAVEMTRARAGALLDARDSLVGLNAFTSVSIAVLPEREPHDPVFAVGEILLDAMVETEFLHWAPLYVRWEVGLLEALGFALDLSQCAATGGRENLVYVSPRSGRAVSQDAGQPYETRMLRLPQFLLASQNPVATSRDIANGLRLTGYFLGERVLLPHGRTMPTARLRLDEIANRESK